jgi:hypothetical protein
MLFWARIGLRVVGILGGYLWVDGYCNVAISRVVWKLWMFILVGVWGRGVYWIENESMIGGWFVGWVCFGVYGLWVMG